MTFFWWVFAAVMAINAAYLGVLYMVQTLDRSLPPRHSIIPGTGQKFLYMQDFFTTSWGDLIAVPLVVNVFAHLVVNGYVGIWQWMVFAAVVIASAIGFARMCLLDPKHKPDLGYPESGKISWTGFLHLPYLGTGVAASVLAVWHIVTGNVCGTILFIGLVGGALYLVLFVADVKCGNFDPLKKIQ